MDASAFMAKLFIVAGFAVLFPYTSEAYPTSVRTTGLGVCTAATRMGGIMTPPLVEGLRLVGKRVPFFGAVAISVPTTLGARPHRGATPPPFPCAARSHARSGACGHDLCVLSAVRHRRPVPV